MKRRDFITLLGGAIATCPLTLRAQQAGHMRRIGVLFVSAQGDAAIDLALLKNTLQELGWTEGRNILIETRWAAADVDRIDAFARELVSLQPDLIVGQTTPVVAALQRETKTIPIVFVVVADPVGNGFVASLPHPGGNITGFINLEASLSGKWIEILKDILPGVTHASLMFNPETAPVAYYQQPFETAARSSGIEPTVAPIRNEADIERVFASLEDKPKTGLVMMPDAFTAVRHNLDLVISLGALSGANCLSLSKYGDCRRPDFLWSGPSRFVSTSANLHRPYPQGRQSSGFAGPASHQIRNGDQSADRESAQP
jgi:putative ABC transport system substrate-binding protein